MRRLRKVAAGEVVGLIVYADVVVASNAAADALLLWGVSRWASRPARAVSIALGGLSGGVYALAVPLALLYPVLDPLVGALGKVIAGLVMLTITFGWRGGRELGRLALWLLGFSFATAGLAFGIVALTASPQLGAQGLPLPLATIPALLAAATVTECGIRRLHAARQIRSRVIPLTVRFGTESLRISALVDSGNNLRDPLSALPVVVAEWSALAPLLPGHVRDVLSQQGEALWAVASSVDADWAPRLRVLPYQTIAGGGLMAALRPDGIRCGDGGRERDQVVVGISHQRLSRTGEYQAIVPPEFLDYASEEGRHAPGHDPHAFASSALGGAGRDLARPDATMGGPLRGRQRGSAAAVDGR